MSQLLSGSLDTWQYVSENCKQREEKRLLSETLQCFFEAGTLSFQINAEDLPPLEALHYLGRTITYNNSYWPAVYQNMRKAQQRWGVIARVTEKTGATVQAQGTMYKAASQFFLLYVSES